ncbi:hypothetical protein SALWKB12_0953 [Snodgrassella communis]|uniref:Uncharacterized protein n=1 Tax=Snodgrassella communis TaxID=2946699 RepID=A0A837AGY0_9NEIS|nr:hypothetical protein SALWKB12_0953 [Snodgrassella communis]KDN15579.1 hypothetical protein SALWKB29_0683 [Snodgrassella communis]
MKKIQQSALENRLNKVRFTEWIFKINIAYVIRTIKLYFLIIFDKAI